MKVFFRFTSVFLLFLFLVSTQPSGAVPSPQGAATLARGKYLADHTSMCSDCHTVRDAHGEYVKGKYLLGSTLTFGPLDHLPASLWASVAPPIAGLTFLTDQQAVVFFSTGKMPDGTFARAPMPRYLLSKSDAAALTAYLKSLPTSGK